MNQDSESQAIDQLSHLGFTGMESAIYLHLLQQGTATGYAISQSLGKPVANTYKAIETLAQKGALEVTKGRGRQYTAVPWKQLLSDHRSRYEANLADLERSLSALPEADDNETVMQLENFDRVLSEIRRIIDEAEHVLLGDFEPVALERFGQSLVAAAARGVEVRIKAYEPADLPGVIVVHRERGEEVYGRTPDVRMQVCADGRETLMALFDAGMTRVLQAFRSRSSLMNLQVYSGQLYELILTELKPLIAAGDLDGSRKVIETTRHLHPFTADAPPLHPYIERYKR